MLPGFGQFILYASTDDCLVQADNVLIMFQLPLWQNCPVFSSFVEYLVVTVN